MRGDINLPSPGMVVRVPFEPEMTGPELFNRLIESFRQALTPMWGFNEQRIQTNL